MLRLLLKGSKRLLRDSRTPFQRSSRSLLLLLVSFFGILYFTCFLPSTFFLGRLQGDPPIATLSTRPQDQTPFRWKDGPKRLVVFGDSSCDNGQYPIDPPPEDQSLAQNVAPGRVWTDWLCSAIMCVHHDNFARPLMKPSSSAASSFPSGSREAIIDDSLLNSTWMTEQRVARGRKASKWEVEEPVADLRAQLQHWLAFERTQIGTSRSKEAEKQSTIFSICFSTWEIWQYSGEAYSNAKIAVTKSMDSLFEQLDLVAENWTSDLKIVLLNAIDPTLLPGWRRARTGPFGSDPFSEDQRNAVLLVEQWNLALEKRARRWKKGLIYIYDINHWLVDQVRHAQLQSRRWKNDQGHALQNSTWQSVEVSCLGSVGQPSDKLQNVGDGVNCPDSNIHLFRDDYHLGSAAMKMVGEDIATIVLGKP